MQNIKEKKCKLNMEIPFFQVPNNIFDLDLNIVAEQRIKKKGAKKTEIVKRPMKTYEKLVYIYICRCGNNNSKAFPSYKTIAQKCCISRQTAIEAIQVLEKNNFLIKESRSKNSNEYTVLFPKVNMSSIPETSMPSIPPSMPSIPETSTPSIPPSTPSIPKKELLKKNYIEKELYKNIIDYLNKKANKNYKHTTKKTQQLINARIVENFTLEDFYKVIDNKTSEWIGKITPEGIHMENYLRPETLFGNKFEGYLNQKGGANGTNEQCTKELEDDGIGFKI